MDNSNNKLQSDYLRTFSTDSGKRVLEHLVEKAINQPIYSTKGDGHAQALQMARRSAEHELVRYIKRMVEKGKSNG